jgi:general secretion pathway protein N
LIGLGLAAYVLGLMAMAPASLIDAALQQASEGRLRLAEARGTLWSGSGQIELRDRMQRGGVAKSLSWRILPAYLLGGQFRCEVGLDLAAKAFPVTVSLAGIEVADADFDLPAATLGIAVPKLAPLGLTGDVLLHVARLSFARGAIQGGATLQWRGAGSAYARVSPLGDYELRFEAEGGAVRAVLRTLQGPLQLDGQGSWAGGGSPAFVGTARIPPEHLQQLAPLMRMIAVERGEGSFALELK